MALKTFLPGGIIYKKGDSVKELALVIKGTVETVIGDEHLISFAGCLVGISEEPGSPRSFGVFAESEATVYTYPYEDIEDVITLLSQNEKLSPTIAQSVVHQAASLYHITEKVHGRAQKAYDNLLSDLSDYPILCAKTGTKSKDYSALAATTSPDYPIPVEKWTSDFFVGLSDHQELTGGLYSLGNAICNGAVMSAADLMRVLNKDLLLILKSYEDFQLKTVTFRSEYATLSQGADAIASGEGKISMPSMDELLSRILLYAEVPSEIGQELTRALDSYSAITNRSDVTDQLRTLRRQIAPHFYTVYKAAFIKSLKDPAVPDIINLFLTFGVLDERIVTTEDLELLYGYMCAYRYNGGKILTIYEWLKKVYTMTVEPSLNEFQQEFSVYLRELKQNGDIREEDMASMLNNPEARLDFEIKNLFTLGNRMTFGRISSFVPIFDSQSKLLPLDKSYLSADRIEEEINRVRALDFSIFYRTKLFIMPDNETIQMFVHEEQTPYVILFPNVGQNLILWQNIEGRKRNSPARFLMPSFFEEKFEDSVTALCGEYRWEVCKTDQSVRWTDITDPSLTAEYHDFLQFFKKNGNLSAEHKEKVRAQIKKYQNNFKKVFVQDYMSYIKYESGGNMRLLKQVREILFKYCTFGKETREHLSHSPQYEKLVEIRANKTEQKVRPIRNIVQKCENQGTEAPEDLIKEIAFFES